MQAILLIFGLAVPLALLLWLLRTRARSWVLFSSVALLVGVTLANLYWAVPWQGPFWPYLYLVAFAAILLIRISFGPRPGTWLPAGNRGWIGTCACLLGAGFWSFGLLGVAQAGMLPDEVAPLRLSSPLEPGTYYVTSGGADFSTNQHFFSEMGRYAIDIAKRQGWGFTPPGVFSADLNSYAIYGVDVVAPCSGEVIGIESSLADQQPGHPDSSKQGTGGNHVVLFCEGHSVLLGHLRPGSVKVAVNQQVSAGQVVGRVGNSGNSMFPHLHIGAVRGRYAYDRTDEEAAPDLESVPLLIDGRFLVRGDQLTVAD